MGIEIPLFPLGVVLFPHMPLPLRIFEERYRVMMGDCERRGTTFGVVAIREGVEAFGPAVPHNVGTLAQLRNVKKLDDGGYQLLVVGASRFRVLTTTNERPYLLGEIEYLEDLSGNDEVTRGLATEVREEFRTYADRLRDLAKRPRAELDLPDEPELLSYLVATLQVELPRKQALLEENSAEARLRGCQALLRRELSLLDRMLARRDTPIATVSKN